MVYNPALNILAKRQQNAEVDSSLAESNMSSFSAALDVTTHTVCPKCNRATSEAKLANGDAVTFCSECGVSIPVPVAR